MTTLALLAAGCLLFIAALTAATLAVHHTLRKVLRALNPVWLWFTGLPLGDGVSRTNATWTMRSRGPRPVLHNTGHAIWWHHLPRLHRAGIRTGSTFVFLGVLAGLVAATFATLVILAIAHHGGSRAGHLARLVPDPQLEAQAALREAAPGDPGPEDPHLAGQHRSQARQGRREVGRDRVAGGNRDRHHREAGGAPGCHDPAGDRGPRRDLAAPRPEQVRGVQAERAAAAFAEWDDDFAAAVKRAAHNELVFGLGKRDAIGTAKYSDSPHLAIPGGSGGGKSELAAFLLLQEMMRGSLIFNLDPKWISHLWLQGLPNVINAHDTPDLHLALCWLGKELTAPHQGRLLLRRRHRPGPRQRRLPDHRPRRGTQLRDAGPERPLDRGPRRGQEAPKEDGTLPKKSPAIAALSALSCAGRASDMHEWLIAQLLTVESTGVKDSTIRTNAGIKAMIRHDAPGWAMAVGKAVPMPPPSTIPGRMQLVTGDERCGKPRSLPAPGRRRRGGGGESGQVGAGDGRVGHRRADPVRP